MYIKHYHSSSSSRGISSRFPAPFDVYLVRPIPQTELCDGFQNCNTGHLRMLSQIPAKNQVQLKNERVCTQFLQDGR